VSEDIFGFAGGIVEDATGFVRFGARDYDPRSGRWTNKDPGGFSGGLNLYAYAVGDPVNVVDSNGRWPMDAGSSWDRWNDFLNQNPEQRPIAAKLGAGALAVGAAEVVALEALPAVVNWLRPAVAIAGAAAQTQMDRCRGIVDQASSGMTTLYHGGNLIEGRVQSMQFSTTTSFEYASDYAARNGGQVFQFNVPNSWLAENGQRFMDSFGPNSGAVGVEFRFGAEAAGQLNQFMDPVSQ
jgi:RHS repeat-associated protein